MKLACLVVLASCGRVGFPELDGGGIAVVIRTAPATILPLATMRLTAVVDGDVDQAVLWSLDEPGAGAIVRDTNGDGLFSAGPADGVVHVRATSAADDKTSTVTAIAISDAISPIPLATNAATDATGLANETHLVYAAELGAWWLFTESSDAPSSLVTRTSTDFATWTDGPALPLGHTHGNDGRNVTLAERVIGGTHVVHLSIGFKDAARGRLHVKATLDTSGLAFGAPLLANQGGTTDPDGPAVAITGQGYVIDGTGWEGTPQTPPLSPCGDGDVEIFTSSKPDLGTTSFDGLVAKRAVIWCVPNRVNSRYLYADDELVYSIYEDGINDPDPMNILYNVRHADGTWLPDETTKTMPPSIFATDTSFALDDWTVRPAAGALHAFRRIGVAGEKFEHRQLAIGSDGPWVDGAAIPDHAGQSGSGVFAAAYGTGIVLVQDDGVDLDYTFWDGVTWSDWRALIGSTATRTDLAGSTPSGGERPAIMWIEGSTVVGAQLP